VKKKKHLKNIKIIKVPEKMRPPKMMPIYIKLFNSQVYSSTLTGNIPESWSKCAKCAKGKGKGEGL